MVVRVCRYLYSGLLWVERAVDVNDVKFVGSVVCFLPAFLPTCRDRSTALQLPLFVGVSVSPGSRVRFCLVSFKALIRCINV